MIKSIIYALCLAWVIMGPGGYRPSSPCTGQAGGSLPDPHHHRSFADNVLPDLAADVRIIEAVAPPVGKREHVIQNAARTLRAFSTQSDEGIERIWVEDLRSQKFYEIQGIPFPNRPISDPVWEKDYLIFDRWVQPHFGTHYVFEMKSRKMVAAMTFAG